MAASASARITIDLPPIDVIFGKSAAMQSVRGRLEKIAAANVPVLIRGESGVGKELAAALIHRLSPWAKEPFVKVSCPAIPGTLLESELFGYEKGAFTGAYGTKPGRVEMAHRGTLFLDEIGDLDPGLQAKLLQLLQDGQFCRIGGNVDSRVEARIVCATNRNLEQEIENGNFRSDLLYRVNVLTLRLPPLRERREDIPMLVEYFLDVYNTKYDCKKQLGTPQLIDKLQSYDWPGNIRQLENLVRRYVLLGEDVLDQQVFTKPENCFDPQIPLDGCISLKKATRQAVLELERKIILKVLQQHHWNRKRTARALDISYRALLYKIRDAGLVF